MAEIEAVTPWPALVAALLPYYPKGDGRGRPPVRLERMLRMYIAQQFFGMSDQGIEDAIYDSQAIRGFVDIDLTHESAPVATTLLKFRRLLEKHNLPRRIFGAINGHLASKGLMPASNCRAVRSKSLIDTANSCRVWRHSPCARQRSRLALSLAEREEISRSLAAGHPIRRIAPLLERAPPTISRESCRNGGQASYRANCVDDAAWKRAQRPKTCKLVDNPGLAEIVATKLQLQWAPEQIAGWLKHTFPGDEDFQVSHETIYRSLFIQARGALKKELLVTRP